MPVLRYQNGPFYKPHKTHYINSISKRIWIQTQSIQAIRVASKEILMNIDSVNYYEPREQYYGHYDLPLKAAANL